MAAVLDLHSHPVVGWSKGSRMQTGLVLDGLTISLWRRRPKDSAIIHTDQAVNSAAMSSTVGQRQLIQSKHELSG
ncbi:MAG: hypothetical protein ACK5BY_07905 [Limnohabitans sp.]|uniref:hypothetical protein n=1 Tax=Limnohabitans sp. TaxID=1907725 RepID=UPI00391AB2CB